MMPEPAAGSKPFDPREQAVVLRLADYRPQTPESVAAAKAAMEAERAASGLPQEFFDHPNYAQMQLDESDDASLLADSASKLLGDGSLERLTRMAQHQYRSLATFLSRSRFICWRQRAVEVAERNMSSLFDDGELGALSATWAKLTPNERQHAVGLLRAVALAGYVSTLDGNAAITPGEYLRLHGQMVGETRK